MGPLVPLLFLIPIFFVAAWWFKETAVVGGIPVITVGLCLVPLWVVFIYLRRFSWFAKNDPDRLQSEEYRYGMARIQTIAAKEWEHPIPADRLSLPEPTENPSHHPTQNNDEESPDSTTEEREIER